MPARQVFSFTSWDNDHPGERPPGDRIDAQFEELLRGQREIAARVNELMRDDGALRNGLVTREALAADFAEQIARQIHRALAPDLDSAASASRVAEACARAVTDARAIVEQAQARALIAARDAEASFSGVASALADREHEARALPAPTSTPLERPDPVLGYGAGGFYAGDVEGATATSADYAQVSIEWAEHMPDTIPPNTLAINAITGDHWSSRWWAHRAGDLVGNFASYYCGAQPTPPTSTITGDPVPIGGLWFDTVPPPGQMMVWNGTAWVPASPVPAPAATSSLVYLATEGQTVFPLASVDVNGASAALVSGSGVMTTVNGVRLAFLQDFTVNVASSTVTLLAPVHLNDVVGFDVLMPAAYLAPTQLTLIKKIKAIVPDGSTTTFPLVPVDSSTITVHAASELIVSVDGVLQEPSVDYVTAPTTVTFAAAPAADSKIFMTWFGAQGAVA